MMNMNCRLTIKRLLSQVVSNGRNSFSGPSEFVLRHIVSICCLIVFLASFVHFAEGQIVDANLLSSNRLASEDTPPNIVLIISDDQAWTDYSFMGHPAIRTPNLDDLAQNSVLFRRGYVPTSLCRPSLMTLITGRYAHQHGVTGNDPSPKYAKPGSAKLKEHRANLIAKIDQFQTLPELLAEQGYFCHQSGKWWEGSFERGGFSHGMTRGFPNQGGRHGDDGLVIGRKGLKPVTGFVDMAVENDKPFFLWYAPFLPHTPHNPPERLLAKYREGRSAHVAKYFAMCEWFDETCGELISHLDQAGIRENTLIVYVTDNGWIQNPEKRGYAARSKQTPYESGVRTPIFFNWPKRLKSTERTELVSSVDLFPTILAAAKANVPDDLPGLNLLDRLIEEKPIDRDMIFGEGFAHDIADINNPEASLLYRWCIHNEWKLILTYDGEVNRYQTTHPREITSPQLFNLSDDPHEQKNLAEDHPEIVKSLANEISNWYPLKERKQMSKSNR